MHKICKCTILGIFLYQYIKHSVNIFNTEYKVNGQR